ncbi:MAG: hypothetical protein F6K11_32195 [Leptolyngbya sp. SIO3F4]|nr:hypothetical protein [Leptolyngbya sp. SIO3F4]
MIIKMADFPQPQYAKAYMNQRLLNIWRSRYVAQVKNISTNSVDFRKYPLEFAASDTGRKKTLGKISEKLIKQASHEAAARTKRLYLQHEYLQFGDTVDLSKFTLHTMPVLLLCYQQQAPLVIYPADEKTSAGISSSLQFGISEIGAVANQLEGCFSEFQLQHSTSKHWLIQCFLTTQINLTSAAILAVLDPVEQAMVKPYFDLLEEYVSIPWQRLCLTANQYVQSSPQCQLVERMLMSVSDISLAVYKRWSHQFSAYAGARGGLNDLKIRRSSLRDFDMFQVYLWLCLLQGNLEPITKELVVFCNLVFKGIGIPWKMTIEGTRLLLNEILGQLNSDEKMIANHVTTGMMDAVLAVG